ncbi:MAG: riboflavin synthase [Flavobacteriales bacterium]|nr:MAG: riboflavin synthase [Flavobacteriales bacterium]
MFTGIIESTAIVRDIQQQNSTIKFTLTCPFANELKIDQSLAHDGCCLTVVEVSDKTYAVQAIDETLKKTRLKNWQIGTEINVERCMKMNGRLDGHIVQGHVDGVGKVTRIEDKDGSYYISFSYGEEVDFVTVPQGSITVNGVSLTVAHSEQKSFSVAIIPYTWEFTNMKNLKIGDEVNLEFDILGKYVAQLLKK